MNIKFSHVYPKLHGQKRARLLRVIKVDHFELSDEFIEYDTSYCADNSEKSHYPLPKTALLILVFLGDELIPFTTARRWTKEKEEYYQRGVGMNFEIVIEKAEAGR